MNVLTITNARKAFGPVVALDGASFDLRKGELLALLGPNGAGKTTTFYMIAGLIQPDAGGISLDGVNITDMPMYQRSQSTSASSMAPNTAPSATSTSLGGGGRIRGGANSRTLVGESGDAGRETFAGGRFGTGQGGEGVELGRSNS